MHGVALLGDRFGWEVWYRRLCGKTRNLYSRVLIDTATCSCGRCGRSMTRVSVTVELLLVIIVIVLMLWTEKLGIITEWGVYDTWKYIVECHIGLADKMVTECKWYDVKALYKCVKQCIVMIPKIGKEPVWCDVETFLMWSYYLLNMMTRENKTYVVWCIFLHMKGDKNETTYVVWCEKLHLYVTWGKIKLMKYNSWCSSNLLNMKLWEKTAETES